MIDTLNTLFSVNTIFFTIFDYPMSYIEFFGTILNILAVYLVAKNNIWTWPVGNMVVILFGILFFQIQLYSDFFEQIYFFITGFYGWWLWNKNSKTKDNSEDLSGITCSTNNSNFAYIVAIAFGTLFLGYVTSNFNTWFPQIFTEAASYPYLDALTTVMSFGATILMINKKIENWYLWILVDIIGIWLYYTKGVVFVSLLYVVFLILATRGYFNWKKLLTK